MGSNIITVKQLIKDAKGKESFLPSDIAFDELERLATLGLHFERILRAPDLTTITKTHNGKWQIVVSTSRLVKHLRKDLIAALNKAGL